MRSGTAQVARGSATTAGACACDTWNAAPSSSSAATTPAMLLSSSRLRRGTVRGQRGCIHSAFPCNACARTHKSRHDLRLPHKLAGIAPRVRAKLRSRFETARAANLQGLVRSVTAGKPTKQMTFLPAAEPVDGPHAHQRPQGVHCAYFKAVSGRLSRCQIISAKALWRRKCPYTALANQPFTHNGSCAGASASSELRISVAPPAGSRAMSSAERLSRKPASSRMAGV